MFRRDFFNLTRRNKSRESAQPQFNAVGIDHQGLSIPDDIAEQFFDLSVWEEACHNGNESVGLFEVNLGKFWGCADRLTPSISGRGAITKSIVHSLRNFEYGWRDVPPVSITLSPAAVVSAVSIP